MGFLLGDAMGTTLGNMDGVVLGSSVGTSDDGPLVTEDVGRNDG